MFNLKQCMTRVSLVVLGMILSMALWGCSALQMHETGVSAGGSSSAIALRGVANGGQQPLLGSVIQLYAVGTSGYGSVATPLLPTSGPSVVTTSDGSGIGGNVSNGNNSLTAGMFTITGDYTCPSNSYVYITVAGGNPQVGGAANPDVALVAALGSCANLQANAASTFITINEVTTVAAVWAFQQFAAITPGTTLYSQPGDGVTAPAFTVGTSATNMQGLINAFGMASVLANTSTGTTPGSNTSGTQSNVETWQVATVANILASCVNSDPVGGAGGTSTNCSSLFNAAKVGSNTPADTLQAAWLMAQNPGNNVQTLFGLVSGVGAPFSGADNYVNDWTIGFAVTTTYGTGNLASPNGLAIDGYGNLWVASTCYNGGVCSNGFITEFDPQGNLISKIANYNTGSTASPTLVTIGKQTSNSIPFQIAIDLANNAWVADRTNGYVFRVGASGSAGGANGGGGAAAFAISTGASTLPTAIAVDGNGTVWATLNGATGYNATFGTSGNLGLAGIIPSGVGTGGPLTGGFIGGNPGGTASVTGYSLVIDSTPTSTYAAAPFIYAVNEGVKCNSLVYGTINHFFAGPGTTVTGSGSNTTTTQGGTTPGNIIADSGVTCTGAGATLSPGSPTYNGSTYSVPALYTPYAAAVDGSNNIWVLNTAIVSSPTGYSTVGLTELVPSFSTNATTGALNASYTANVIPSVYDAAGVGLPSDYSTPQYIAIDGGNNIWLDTAAISLPGALSSFAEYSSTLGQWLSPTSTTSITASRVSNGWYGGNTGTSTQRISQTRKAMGIDLSGNVWTENASSAGNTLFCLVGAAVPTVNPISVALKNHTVGTRP